MATRRNPPSIEAEDVSQLSILAYQVRTHGDKPFDVRRFLARLKSDHARSIARVIAGESGADDETTEKANYYLRWADETARSARAASRRPRRR